MLSSYSLKWFKIIIKINTFANLPKIGLKANKIFMRLIGFQDFGAGIVRQYLLYCFNLMTQALPKPLTIEEFARWYPIDSECLYELHNGVIVEMPLPIGEHEEVIGFLTAEFSLEYRRIKRPYFIPKTVFVHPPNSESAYSPDILLLNKPNLVNEPIWKKESIITLAESISLVVEIVSTNWRDDYLKKYADYEEMRIPEYWIVDYAALGGREFIGKPKQPTISICSLDENEYHVSKFRGDDLIQSPTFPELNLTAQQIFQAGNNDS